MFVATVVRGEFQWDEAKATSNLAKRGVSFEEATLVMKDRFSQDFDDAVHPANLVTLAVAPFGAAVQPALHRGARCHRNAVKRPALFLQPSGTQTVTGAADPERFLTVPACRGMEGLATS